MKWYHWLAVPLAAATFGAVIGAWLYSPDAMKTFLTVVVVSLIWVTAILVSAIAHALVNRSYHPRPKPTPAEPAPAALEGQYRVAPDAPPEFFVDGRATTSSGYLPAPMAYQTRRESTERNW